VTVLPRDDRLHPRSRVRTTIRSGRRVRSGSLIVHHAAGEGGPHVAVVTVKGFDSAVARHRRQRQVRHALAGIWTLLPDGDLVVRALPEPVSFPQLCADLRAAVKRL
jgi:ribonuclease P protein component